AAHRRDFFFCSRRRHTRFSRDWSSDVCSSDLGDPAYESTFYKWDVSETAVKGRRPSKSMSSTHLWSAKLPTSLNTGEHTIKVKATDMYGKVHYGETIFKITE